MKRIVQTGIGLSLLIAAHGWGAIHRVGGEYAPFGRLPGHQQNPDVAIGASGGFVVWQNSDRTSNGERVVIHKLNELLEGQGSPVRLSPDSLRTDETHPRVALLPNGGAVVVWESGGRTDREVRVRFMNAAGYPVTPVQTANGFKRGNQAKPDVAVNDHGDVLVVWESERQDGDGKGVYAQRYTPGGIRVGGEIHVSQTIKWNQSRPTCVALKDGRFVIAWIGEAAHGTTQAGTPYMRGHVMGRLMDRHGTGIGNEFRLDGGQSLCTNPHLLALKDGGFGVGWAQRDEAAMANLWDVYYRAFNQTGLPLGRAQRHNNYTADVQKHFVLASLGDELLMAWDCGTFDGASSEVHGRLISGGSEFRVNTKVALQQRMAATGGDGAGQVIVLWVDVVNASNTTLLAQKLSTKGAGANLAAGPAIATGPVGRMRSALAMKVNDMLALPGPQLAQERNDLKQEAIVKHESTVQEAAQVSQRAAAKSASRALIKTAERTSLRGHGLGSIARPNVNTAAVAETRQAKAGRVRVTRRLSMRPAANPAAVNIQRVQTVAPARVANPSSALRRTEVSRTSMAAQNTLSRYARNYSATRQSAARQSLALRQVAAPSPVSPSSRARYSQANRIVPSRAARPTASHQAAQRAMQQYARRRMSAASSQSRFTMRPMPSAVPRGVGAGRSIVRRSVSPGVSSAQKRAQAMHASALERANQANRLRGVPVPATLDQSGGRMNLRFNTEAGRRYVVQTSADKNNWRNTGQVQRGTGRSMSLPVNARGGQRFIRVVPAD